MARFSPIRCYDCGIPIDDMYEVYRAMRTILRESIDSEARVHVEKEMLDTVDAPSEAVIFKALNIRPEEECCRTHFLTTVLPKDLETRGSIDPSIMPDDV